MKVLIIWLLLLTEEIGPQPILPIRTALDTYESMKYSYCHKCEENGFLLLPPKRQDICHVRSYCGTVQYKHAGVATW